MPILAAALASVLLAAACSGDGAAATTAAETTTTAVSAPTGTEFEVVMESFAFTPPVLTVPVGATVTWENRHAARHDVVAAGGAFASPLFGQGETFSFTFTAPGEYPYVCTIHPGMEGTIVVTP